MEHIGLFDDYDRLRFWVDVFMALFVVVSAGCGFWIGRWQALRSRQESLKDELAAMVGKQTAKLSELRADLTALERQVGSLPSHDDLGQVYARISTMDNNLAKLMGQVEGMSRGLDNINHFLLNATKGGPAG